jgi:uncharacterized membrane protein (UPF0127 family)
MPVYNKHKNITLPFQVVEANSFLKRLVGLLGTKMSNADKVLYIKHCSGVHTIGMNYPIDVVFLDKNFMVSRLYQSLKDFAVLEFPPGTIKDLDIEKGEILQIITDKYKSFGD